jgi:hypothetical protein
MRLGYEVLVKIKVDELLERECIPTNVSQDGGHVEIATTSREGLTGVNAHGAAPADRPGGPGGAHMITDEREPTPGTREHFLRVT